MWKTMPKYMELGTEIKTENQHSNSENDVEEVTRRAPTTDDEKEKNIQANPLNQISYNEIDMNVVQAIVIRFH
jgi:hypothetical protein